MESDSVMRRVTIRSRRELEPYGDLILDLLGRPGINFKDLPAALADQGICASEKIIRSVREGLNQRKHIRRDHKERMIGIYRKWKGKDVVIQYKGEIQTYAKLERAISYRGKKHHLDEQDLIRLENYTGPTPKEIYYFDPSNPDTNLLEADGCDWDPAEKDEALHYIIGTSTEEPCQTDLQNRLSPAFSAAQLTASPPEGSSGRQNEPIQSILPTPDHAPNSIWEWVGMAYDHTCVLSGDESNGFRTLMLDLYVKLYGSTQYDPQLMATLSNQFLDRGMFDEAEKIASAAVILAERFYGPTDARSLLAVVSLANVRTQQGRFHEAYRIGEAAVNDLKNTRGDYDGDVLQSECLFCETLLELDRMERAKTVCCNILKRSIPDINVTYDTFMSFKIQLARICNARAEYFEAKELLEQVAGECVNRYGFSDERTLRASVELIQSLRGLGDWEAIIRASQLEREIKRREAIGIPRGMWTMELVFSIGVQLHSLGAYFEAEKVFRNYSECLRGMIQLPRHPKLVCAEAWIACTLYNQGKSKEARATNARLLTAAEEIWGPHHRFTLSLMSNMAWTMNEDAPFTVFETHTYKVRDLRSKYLGEDDPDTLDSERSCIYVKIIRGEWDESLIALEKIHDSQKKRLDFKGRVEVLSTLLSSGKILSGRGRDSKAESPLRQALHLGKCLFGPDHPCALKPLVPLVNSLARLGRYSEAEKLLSEGTSTLVGSLGWNHYQVMELKLVHAKILGWQEKYADAEELQSYVLKAYTETYGTDHPYVIEVAHQLAISFGAQNMAAEAQALLERAMRSCQSTFGPQHQRRCHLELSIAKLFKDRGNLTKALSLGQSILEVAHASFGTIEAKNGDLTSYLEHPSSLQFREDLAITYTRLGDITQSIELLRKNLALRTKLLGPNHPDTISSLSHLANVYSVASEYLTAEHLYRDAVERSTVTFGSWHAQTVEAMVKHGGALRDLRRYTESNAIFYKTLDWIFNNKRGEYHSIVAEIYHEIALLHLKERSYDEAVRFFKYALKMYRKLKNELAVITMTNLCSCYIFMGAYSKAETQAVEAAREAEKTLGSDHPQTIVVRIGQASALLMNEKYVDVDLLTDVLRQDIESREGKDSARLLEVNDICGRSLYAQGRMTEAEAFLESCINVRLYKDPRDPWLCSLIHLLGDVKEELGNMDGKEAIFQCLLDRLETQNELNSLGGSSKSQVTFYAEIMEELAQIKAFLHKYDSAEVLMRKALDFRKELWGEGSPQVCDTERKLANCIPRDRPLDRLKMQEEVLSKYWVSTGSDMKSAVPLLLDMAENCSILSDFESEVTLRELIISSEFYPSERNRQYAWDVQRLSLAYYNLQYFEDAERLLESLDELIDVDFPGNLRDRAWTLHLLAKTKRALGKLDAAASTLEQSLLAGTKTPSEKIGNNLNRLDLLVDLNMELGRWSEAKNAWVELLRLREEAQATNWPLSTRQFKRMEWIDAMFGETECLSNGEPP